jgi:hypothetical protein
LLLRRLVVGALWVVPPVDEALRLHAAARMDTDAQAHLAQALAATGAFSLQLRTGIDARPDAQGLSAFREALTGVDALLVGSIEVSSAPQDTSTSSVATATLPGPAALVSARFNLRAIDPYTGEPLFLLGARRDGPTRDQALALASQDAARSLLAQFAELPWQAYVLAVDGERVRLSAGQAQGLQPGQLLEVQTQGDRVRSRRTGLLVALPGPSVARLQLEGDGFARRVAGSLAGLAPRDLVVRLAPASSSLSLTPALASSAAALSPLPPPLPRKSP